MADESRWRPFSSPHGLARTALGATFLGLVIGSHLVLGYLALAAGSDQGIRWTAYVLGVAVFHLLDFFSIAWVRPEELSYDSMLLNHSVAYGVAALAAWTEFGLGALLWPAQQTLGPVFFVGLAVLLAGQVLRVTAMLTAGRSFGHLVESGQRREDHVLVTTGVYRYCRHPAYLGFFWWSVATQLVLGNPLCFVLYVAANVQFFRGRIFIEEEALLKFFGRVYARYAYHTPCYIPLVESPPQFAHIAMLRGASGDGASETAAPAPATRS